jgi:hypothetical protein
VPARRDQLRSGRHSTRRSWRPPAQRCRIYPDRRQWQSARRCEHEPLSGSAKADVIGKRNLCGAGLVVATMPAKLHTVAAPQLSTCGAQRHGRAGLHRQRGAESFASVLSAVRLVTRPDPQSRRQGLEHERRFKGDGLTVQAGNDGPSRAHSELGGSPFPHSPGRRRGKVHRHNPERAFVDPASGPPCSERV